MAAAITSLLGLHGDPYQQIEDLACVPSAYLRALLGADRAWTPEKPGGGKRGK
jgi:hypothetical protein